MILVLVVLVEALVVVVGVTLVVAVVLVLVVVKFVIGVVMEVIVGVSCFWLGVLVHHLPNASGCSGGLQCLSYVN